MIADQAQELESEFVSIDEAVDCLSRDFNELHHVREQLAIRYVAALDKFGKDLQERLAKSHERAFLRGLEAVGRGKLDKRALNCEPAKRNALMTLTVEEQGKLLEEGVNGMPFSSLAPSVVKRYAEATPAERRQQVDRVPVDNYDRKKPRRGASPPPPLVPKAEGLRVGRHLYEYEDVQKALREASEAGYL